MAKDRLEKFIEENKASFDNQGPSEKLWSRIEETLPYNSSYYWIWKVAAVIFFCSTIYLFLDRPASLDLTAEKELLATDFGDIENFYFQIISEKRDLIYEYDQPETPIEVDFEQDLQKLDAMYQVLKDELKANPSKKVVDALILNLLVRIDVLNGKIEELEGNEEVDEPSEEGLAI